MHDVSELSLRVSTGVWQRVKLVSAHQAVMTGVPPVKKKVDFLSRPATVYSVEIFWQESTGMAKVPENVAVGLEKHEQFVVARM